LSLAVPFVVAELPAIEALFVVAELLAVAEPQGAAGPLAAAELLAVEVLSVAEELPVVVVLQVVAELPVVVERLAVVELWVAWASPAVEAWADIVCPASVESEQRALWVRRELTQRRCYRNGCQTACLRRRGSSREYQVAGR